MHDRLNTFLTLLVCFVVAVLAILLGSALQATTADTIEGGSQWVRVSVNTGSQWV